MTFNASKNLSDQIADYLVDQVVSLKIPPGERIMEEKLAKELGVSRSPVREAFRILEQTGLVELIPRCGIRARAITQKSVEDYCDMFSLLLGHVTRRCIEHGTDEQVRALSRVYREMETFAKNDDHKLFHEALIRCVEIGIEATGNPALEQVITTIMPNLKRFQYIAILLKAGSLTDSFEYFKVILDALITRNPDKGAKAIEAYIENEMRITLAHVKKSDLAQFIVEKEP
jgi:DNA-binding GntR family transcriptional regulator